MHVRVRDYVRVRVLINLKKYSAKYIYLIVTWLSDTKVSKYTFGFAHLLGHGCFLVL